MNDKIFSERIKILMAGASANAFAQKCDIDPKVIRKAKEGNIPGTTTLRKIVDKYEVTTSWLTGETKSGGPGQPQAAEPVTQCNQPEISDSRQLVISRLATLIAFLEDTYDGLPSELDKCLNSIKHHLRKNCDFYTSWEDAQEAVLRERRKKCIGANHQGGFLQANEVNRK